jgi:hypothetical protein
MRMRAFLSLTVGFLFVSCATDRFERYHITADELPGQAPVSELHISAPVDSYLRVAMQPTPTLHA